MKIFRIPALVVLFGFFLAQSAFAEPEWPRFRGPNGAGVVESADIPATWGDSDFLWKTDLPGVGHGSPVVAGDRIFVLCAELETSKRIAVCVSAKDGSILWKKEYETEKFKGHRMNSPASTTPAVDDENVYFTWGTKERLSAVAITHDGDEVWQADLGPVKGGHGFGASPMVYGNLVVINNDQDGESSLIALHKASGEKAWEIPRKSQRLSYSVPVVKPTPDGDVLVFTNWQHGFTAVDPASGKVLSEASVFNLDTNERAISSPILAGDLIIGACGFTNEPKHAVAMKYEGGKLEEVWRIERNVPHIPSMIVIGERVFFWEDKGIGTCVNHQTGEVIWRERIGGATFFGSPVSDGEKIFCADADGVVVVLAASDEFKELGRTELGETCRSTPAIAHGNLYVRTFQQLLAVKGR
ncbi:MAG: outer membrane protein assembly factor BamB [Verrucomicrobiales bacterium]|jgi:outer membrane protein assembly factor BamB